MILLKDYLMSTFGHKLYKVSLDGGFSCPNRDGTIGTRGCIFCSGAGSGDFASSRSLSITEQINEGRALVSAKNPGGRYIAYFQAFTSTYGPIDKLRSKFTEAIEHPDIDVLSIATRPDCLGPEVLELLRELNEIKPVWVELGLQTIHEHSARYIRRGYELSVYDRAVRDLTNIGISQIITHVILGLPGESREEMLETVKYVGMSGATGIKLQLLHVLDNTDLAEDYRAGKFECLTLDEYVTLIEECIKILPDNMVVHRLTGDGNKKYLIAPLWSGDKKRVLNRINEVIRKQNPK